MTTRDAFLAKLRGKLREATPSHGPHPIVPVASVPHVAYPFEIADPVAVFAEKAEALGSQVRRTDDPAEVLGEVVREHAVRTAVVSADDEVSAARDFLAGLGVQTEPSDVAKAAAADLGVTGAAWAIAATGTLVLDASRAGGRTASLLPPVHLAIVRESRIFATSSQLFREMGARFGEELPSQFVLASGPSRSADIELTLTVGVHGPRHVWIAILPG